MRGIRASFDASGPGVVGTPGRVRPAAQDSLRVMSEPQSLLRSVFRNTGVLLAGKSVTAVLALAYTALAARTLGLEAFGLLVLIHAFAQTVAEIVNFQAWQAVIQYGTAPLRDGRTADFHRVLRFGLLLDGLGAAAALVLAVGGVALFADRLGWPAEHLPAAMLYATVVVLLAVETPLGTLRLLGRFDLIALNSGISAAVRLAGAAAAFLAGAGLVTFLVIWYAAAVIGFGVLMGFTVRELRRRTGLASAGWTAPGLSRGMPGIWRFAAITNLNSALNLGSKQVTVLIVGGMLGAQEAALFRVAKQVADAMVKPTRLLVPALYPELASLASQGRMAELHRLVIQVGVLAGGAATVLLAVAAVLGAPALELILGQAFVGAADVMIWLVAMAVISIWTMPLEPMLISLGLAGRTLAVRIVVTATYLPLTVVMIGRYGLEGVGYAMVACAVLTLAGLLAAALWGNRPAPEPAGRQSVSGADA